MLPRKLCENQIEAALELVSRVFLEFEAPDYGQQGVEEFHKSIRDPQFLGRLRWYGAFVGDELVGVIATRDHATHIALLFVDGGHHRRGIGRSLFRRALQDNSTGRVTVNSSPFALPAYERLGFRRTGGERVTNGIRYLPMEWSAEGVPHSG